ncbi:hypothetical protein [Pseudarthrobacter albicanus]|uniref:hypothetical protein n=1 Tax=Pseudarthrobacter albicanus TaxID=2823873 RepID=UPI001BAB3A4D|nr:hypothetical protein [Pseudarthrobacter albicanus]
MSWSVSAEPAPDWAVPVLLTVGRATYVAQNFENNCKDLLTSLQLTGQLMGLADAEPYDFGAAIDEIMDDLRDRDFIYLNSALTQLKSQSRGTFTTDGVALLNDALKARNWIAHEGARFDIHAFDPSVAIDCLKDLLPHVRTLAAADDLVAGVKADTEYQSSSQAGGRPLEVGSYELLVERWVFAPVAGLSGAPTTR